MQHTSQRGFTLVELAIVLVIIGLISGGILAGSGMIRNAEVQSVGEDFLKYETAINNFKAHYFALPGDYARATDQWGTLPSCPNDEAIGTSATCDGNDDNLISGGETYRAWQHLANAEMISGPYTGTLGAGIEAGRNIPSTRVSLGAMRILVQSSTCPAPCGLPNYYFTVRGNVLMFSSTVSTNLGVITPQEAFQIDKKFDDGLPASGKILSVKSTTVSAPGCTTSDDPTNAQYDGTQEERRCLLYYPFHKTQ